MISHILGRNDSARMERKTIAIFENKKRLHKEFNFIQFESINLNKPLLQNVCQTNSMWDIFNLKPMLTFPLTERRHFD